MDPNACLQRFIRALKEDLDEAREAYSDLRNWIRRGGFEPTWPSEDYRELWFAAGSAFEGVED